MITVKSDTKMWLPPYRGSTNYLTVCTCRDKRGGGGQPCSESETPCALPQPPCVLYITSLLAGLEIQRRRDLRLVWRGSSIPSHPLKKQLDCKKQPVPWLCAPALVQALCSVWRLCSSTPCGLPSSTSGRFWVHTASGLPTDSFKANMGTSTSAWRQSGDSRVDIPCS